MLGFAGCHRSGKTTLAREVAAAMGMTFLETRATDVFKDLNLSPRDELPFADRILVQNAILFHLEKQYRNVPNNEQAFVADRTPLDVLAYTYAELGRTALEDPQTRRAFERHRVAAYEIANRHFHRIIVVQPGIPIKDAPGKAPPCPHYMEHLNMVCKHVVASPFFKGTWGILDRDLLSLRARVSQCLSVNEDIIHIREALQQTGGADDPSLN